MKVLQPSQCVVVGQRAESIAGRRVRKNRADFLILLDVAEECVVRFRGSFQPQQFVIGKRALDFFDGCRDVNGWVALFIRIEQIRIQDPLDVSTKDENRTGDADHENVHSDTDSSPKMGLEYSPANEGLLRPMKERPQRHAAMIIHNSGPGCPNLTKSS